MALAEIEALEALTPPLKWAGGKRWLVPHLLRLWKPHAHRRLVEPFVGGLAVTLGLQPERALLNDANPHLIWFYQNLQRGLVLDPKTAGFANDRAVYGAHRVRFNQLIADGMGHTPEAAGLFYYLNRTGFNGLCRFNRSGAFNVPHGRYSAALSYRYDFLGYTSALRSYDFACGDFGDINIDVADFIYADPPYDVEFVSYSKDGFSWDDQVRLATWLAKHPAPAIASNAATPRVLKLYRAHGFKVKTLPAPRRISCDGNRDDAQEMLATKGL